MERIADKVNIDAIKYAKAVRTHKEKALVNYTPANGTLFFNSKMVKILDMVNWKQVIVGYDKTSNIIVLKNCDAEEYGSVMVRTGKSSNKDASSGVQERLKNSRVISINHLIRKVGVSTSTRYRAERDGVMIFLEHMDES